MLHDLGQSPWLDNSTRELLNAGTLNRYMLSVTGLTSNPTILDHAIKNSAMYDADIVRKASSARSGEDLFFDLAMGDLTRAARGFRHTMRNTYVRRRRHRPTFLLPLSRRLSISSPRQFGPLSSSVQGPCVRRGGAPGSPNLASIEYFPAPVTNNRKKPPMRLTFL